MQEREIGTTRLNRFDPPTGFERALGFAGDVASDRNLDPLKADALSKFATITYRINEVARDFQVIDGKLSGISLGGKAYNIGFDENNILLRKQIRLMEFPEFLRVHNKMAVSLYDQYLNSDENTRGAAKEVEEYVEQLMALEKK